jgi:hypothetical protein
MSSLELRDLLPALLRLPCLGVLLAPPEPAALLGAPGWWCKITRGTSCCAGSPSLEEMNSGAEAFCDALRWRSAKLLLGPGEASRDCDAGSCVLLLLLLLLLLEGLCSLCRPPEAEAEADAQGDRRRAAALGDAGGRPWLPGDRLEASG